MSETVTDRKPRAPARRQPAAQPRRDGGGGRRLVIVSNRVAEVEKGKSSSGGLAVAIQAALAEHGGIWFGWSGAVNDPSGPDPHVSVDGKLTYATLDLSQRDFDEYYNGYSNRVLWPLVHFRPDLIEFSRANLAGYLRVNRQFAQGLAPLLAAQDLIWVHDYHLIPLAEELRRLDCTQPIGFFLHTPFPPAELLRTLPNHTELVKALCAFDLVGFQSAPDLEGFRDYLVRWVGAEDLGHGMLRVFDRVVRTAVFPIGIDVDHVAAQAKAAAGSRQSARLGESLHNRALMIGVDRLDYSKGLPGRFAAYSLLLEKNSDMRGRIVFLQIASPSRSDVPEYREIRRRLATLAGNINGRYSEFDWTPLRYLNKSFNHRILTGFYRASRIALVTPRRDGMNLVAKEYVASQDPENPGMLVLSCFAGAAHELGQSILVNPYDIEGMAEAIRQGFEMPLGERKERWTTMIETLKRNDITAWRERFVEALSAIDASEARG
jgi:trehalose 6-phosphate synthase